MSIDPFQPSIHAADALRSPSIYDDCRQTPKVMETHISMLYLTDSHVYKLKKPVDFGFLDYSSVDKRRAACESELTINRRLAPDVYLAVVPVGRGRDGRWQIGGDIEAEDWLVQMKRLPDDRCFENMLSAGTWTEDDIHEVITKLTGFYRQANRVHSTRYLDRFVTHVCDNQSELEKQNHGLPLVDVRRIHSAQRKFLFLNTEMVNRRVAEDHVVDGHGDLRAEHVYVTAPPVVIDGIEFSRELRTVDIADELCFFAVTCENIGAKEIGERILLGVLSELDDRPHPRLLDFYRSYRACVRAKVESLRSDQTTGNAERTALHHAGAYLEIADFYARRLGPPMAVIVRGLSGTGKTTFATALSLEMGAAHLSTDQIRKSSRSSTESAEYDETARRKVYEIMLAEAIERIGGGESTILDGTFLQAALLRRTIEACKRAGATTCVLTCVCPDEVAMQRIRERHLEGKTLSDADEAVFKQQREEVAGTPHVSCDFEVDTTEPSKAQLNRVRDMLRSIER